MKNAENDSGRRRRIKFCVRSIIKNDMEEDLLSKENLERAVVVVQWLDRVLTIGEKARLLSYCYSGGARAYDSEHNKK